MKYIIETTLTNEQRDYLKSLARENNISFTIYTQDGETETVEEKTSTPITDDMLISLARETNMSLLIITGYVRDYGIETLEDALAHENVSQEVKAIIETMI